VNARFGRSHLSVRRYLKLFSRERLALVSNGERDSVGAFSQLPLSWSAAKLSSESNFLRRERLCYLGCKRFSCLERNLARGKLKGRIFE
jgi:hypothetical protein